MPYKAFWKKSPKSYPNFEVLNHSLKCPVGGAFQNNAGINRYVERTEQTDSWNQFSFQEAKFTWSDGSSKGV